MSAKWLARVPLFWALGFCLVFAVLPLAIMAIQSISTPEGYSLTAYRALLADPVDRLQLMHSLELGLASTAISWLFGFGHAWLTERSDMPASGFLGPLGFTPLVLPPILLAMGFADTWDVAGFWGCAFILGIAYAPFVAVLVTRGMRAIDGRLYEAALLARGRLPAESLLFRMILPELACGCLLAFIFVVSEHGVPEFLTVKGKTWHTYAEGIFARWTRRALGVEHDDLVGPIVAALPLVLIISVALYAALRLRASSTLRGDLKPLPIRHLGVWRWPALALPVSYLFCGVVLPVVVMTRWAAGSTQVGQGMALAELRVSFRDALFGAGGDLVYTLGIGAGTVVVLLLVSIPLARFAARRMAVIEYLAVLPLAVPGIILAIGLVAVFNNPVIAGAYSQTFDFYDSWAIVCAAYAARFLPFAVLTLSNATRRIPKSLEEAALLSGRGPWARFRVIDLPLILPAAWSASCLVFILAMRELDLAVVFPAGNGTVVRRLSNIVHFGGEGTGGALALLLLMVAIAVPILTILLTGKKLRSLS